MASSERYSSSLSEIQTEWSLTDLLDANEVLDLYAVEEQRAADEAKKKGRSKHG